MITGYGCSTSYDESAFTLGVGNYKFTMTDSTGNKLAEGNLVIKTYKNTDISGTYEFTNIFQNDFRGLSAMDGEFSGTVNKTEKRVFINTNPRIADSNVFWNMDIKKSSLNGDWIYSMFRGTGNKGKVKIFK
ncbi:MAG: hypothetical protein ABI528_07295 [bacterium]